MKLVGNRSLKKKTLLPEDTVTLPSHVRHHTNTCLLCIHTQKDLNKQASD